MIVESGVVVSAAADGRFLVETRRRSACGSCSVSSGCGTSVIGKITGGKRNIVTVLSPLTLAPGDEVELGLAEGALISGSLIVYGVPLLGLLLGMIVYAVLLGASAGDGAAIVCGLGGLAIGMATARHFAHAVRRDPRYQPVVLRRL